MKKLKKIIIAVAVIGAVGVGSLIGWTYLRKNNVQPVKVFSFDNVGMTQYWRHQGELRPCLYGQYPNHLPQRHPNCFRNPGGGGADGKKGRPAHEL